MSRRQMILTTIIMMSLVAISAACGGGGDATPEPQAVSTLDPIEQSVSQTIVAISVIRTVEALTNNQQATEVPQSPTDSPPPTVEDVAANPTDAPTAEAATEEVPPTATAEQDLNCATVTATNARSGPGTAFDPPIGSVSGNTELIPVSFVANGIPGGQWLEAQVAATGQIVWLSFSPQFVTCDFDATSLPGPASIPPTPRPAPTPTPLPATPTRVVARPPDVSNNAPGGACEEGSNIIAPVPVVDPNYLFRIMARDARGDDFDGAGIDHVRFEVLTYEDRDEVYVREERTAAYCIFQGGEPNCNPWSYDDQGRSTWGAGGPVVESGKYHMSIKIVSRFAPEGSPEGSDPETCNWDFDITVDVAP